MWRWWVSDSSTIKRAASDHFSSRFSKHNQTCPNFINDRFKRVSVQDASFLESPFTHEEIKEAVWACDGSKAPGPDDMNFTFIKKYWHLIKSDFFDFASYFWKNGTLSKGCNASFIALIPKKLDPLELGDFRPISLLGCQYKVIAKLLAGRLWKVIEKVISGNQTAFIKGRQIMDGCLLAN